MTLTLIANTREQILAQIDAMPSDQRAQVSPVWLDWVRTAPPDDAWAFGYSILDDETGTRVGTCAFKSEPSDDGVVEIAYGVSQEFEGRGIATWAAGAVTRRAFESDRVQIVRAHTFDNANASAHVLERNGFQLLGTVIDPEDGEVWRWERRRTLAEGGAVTSSFCSDVQQSGSTSPGLREFSEHGAPDNVRSDEDLVAVLGVVSRGTMKAKRREHDTVRHSPHAKAVRDADHRRCIAVPTLSP